ncbi:MAG: response regulator [Salinivirgaceae bacterium]|jgi:ligand-binding sensor domain-containing protein/signal transduction histidine kinase/DNA-binding response OmpR family regulator|nr:response regulator [Salinivirgaceae bacterium]
MGKLYQKVLHLVVFVIITGLQLKANTNQIVFHHLNVENGLSQSWVGCIAQDSLGFMWFGTSNGLNKYDGYNFTIYTHNKSKKNSIVSNHVQGLEVDATGDIWVGTNAGLCFYDYQTDKFIYNQQFTDKSVNCLTISDEVVYAGTSDGIFIFNINEDKSETLVAKEINSLLSNQRINAITHDSFGQIWIGTSKGLFVFGAETHRLTSDIIKQGELSLQNKFIRAIEVDVKNRVWIGTSANGLCYLPSAKNGLLNEERYFFRHSKMNSTSINEGKIQAIHVDAKNKLLVGIENGGVDFVELNEFDRDNVVFHHQMHDPGKVNSLSNKSIYSIFEDKRGDIWIGTYGGGVNFYNNDGENFNVLTHIHNEKNSLINKIVNVIIKHNNQLWIGTEGGISILDLKENTFNHLSYSVNSINSLRSNAIWALHFDLENNVWIGTWAGGMSKLDARNNYTHFANDVNNVNSLSGNNIFAITQDANNDLWIGTLGGGINKYIISEDKIVRFNMDINPENSTLINEIRHLYYNSLGELWFSTSISVGYIDVNTNMVYHFFPKANEVNSFEGNGAYVIFEDSKANMWFGTDVGINFFNREMSNFKSYSLDDGLPNNSIKSIQEDSKGNLWLGTNDGLIKFKNATTLPADAVFKTFDISDGIIGNEFNRRASFKDENGKMYFGGPNGLTYFHPDSIKENTTIPNVVFTNFSIFNQPVKIGDLHSPLTQHINLTNEIVLRPKQTVFSLEYAALSYIASEKNQYAYKLEGFDEEWSYVGSQKLATYTNLNPGNYIFKVKAANNDGYWNEKPTELKITILPPWYKTRWALGLYIILVMLSIYLYINITQKRFKVKEALRLERLQRDQEKELNQQRLQFFTNISHEFRTPLTLIYSPIENILKNYYNKLPHEVKGQLSTIYKNALRLNRLATELMDFRKLQFNKLNMKISQQDICAFTQNVANLFNEEADLNKINFTSKIPNGPIFLWYDQSMIEKVLFNLLSNAFKVTTENGSIGIEIQESDKFPEYTGSLSNENWICIKVSDTGTGLSREQIKKIFERFYQADNYSKTYYSSTGIGLSLAKGLIEKHGGDITVDSLPGEGSDFKVWLKVGNDHFSPEELKKAPKEIIEPDPNPLPIINTTQIPVQESDKSISVLIVEDNRELRDYLAKELQKYYKVIEARNGKIGIELAEKHLPDIIISDVLMPETDGLELCRAIKNNEGISHIPIILLTARASVEDQIEGTEAGADAYIVKPFNPDLLKSRVTQLLQSRKQLFSKFSADLRIIPQIDVFTNYDKTFLQRVSDYIIENISNADLSVEELGDRMHLSRSQLYRKIKSLTGHSATEFIRIIRLEQAKKLIVVSRLPINEVGYKVGFGTPSYFSKCYKEHFGKLPSEE